MARKMIARKIASYPLRNLYGPADPVSEECVEVLVEELEAMRLKDVEALNQQEAAGKMGISRQTFQNIVDSGRKKVAEALFGGKNIAIVGGNHVLTNCEMICAECDESYSVEYIDDKKVCPSCGGVEVTCVSKDNYCKIWCID